MQPKKWYESKTIWFNLVMLLLQIVNLISQSPLLADKTSVLEVLAGIEIIGNIVLRFITNTPVQKSLI